MVRIFITHQNGKTLLEFLIYTSAARSRQSFSKLQDVKNLQRSKKNKTFLNEEAASIVRVGQASDLLHI